jgi:hypothetical protein
MESNQSCNFEWRDSIDFLCDVTFRLDLAFLIKISIRSISIFMSSKSISAVCENELHWKKDIEILCSTFSKGCSHIRGIVLDWKSYCRWDRSKIRSEIKTLKIRFFMRVLCSTFLILGYKGQRNSHTLKLH